MLAKTGCTSNRVLFVVVPYKARFLKKRVEGRVHDGLDYRTAGDSRVVDWAHGRASVLDRSVALLDRLAPGRLVAIMGPTVLAIVVPHDVSPVLRRARSEASAVLRQAQY